MKNKNIIIGIISGFVATLVGSIIVMILFKGFSLQSALQQIIEARSLNKIINLGALLNFGVFYFFLNKKQDQRAKGVVIATIFLALIFIINKFF